MPECYTLLYTATRALKRGGYAAASPPAFRAGALGLLPLHMYQLWQAQPRPNLPALAAQMRHEDTGAFLLSLVQNAVTPAQQSYALGFVSHYITNCTVSPYIIAMSGKGAVYDLPDGRYHLTAALDSELYYRDYKLRTIPLHVTAPRLLTAELAGVTSLLRAAISAVYHQNIPQVALSDAFHAHYQARKMLLSPTGRLALKFYKPTTHPAFGPLVARIKPEALLPLPLEWAHPQSGIQLALTYPDLLEIAQESAVVCLSAVINYWLGTVSEQELATILGSNDYDTGLPYMPPVEEPQVEPEQEPPAPLEVVEETAVEDAAEEVAVQAEEQPEEPLPEIQESEPA